METKELTLEEQKEELIKAIADSQDMAFLKKLKNVMELEAFKKEHTRIIDEGIKQVEKGHFITLDELEERTKKFFEERGISYKPRS